MNYALSTPNVLSLISGTTSPTDLASKLIAAFESVGWTLEASISGGATLQGVSPQGYLVWCDIVAVTGAITIQLHSAVGSGAAGFTYPLAWDASYSWQAIVHPCGFAICRPDDGGTDLHGSSVIGGIPFVATACGVSGALGTVTEIWFSFGDSRNDSVWYADSPRSSIDVGHKFSSYQGNQTGCINGVMGSMTGLIDVWDVPEILRFSSAATDSPLASRNSHPLFFGEGFLTYPAFISWPTGTGGNPVKIRGQVYNACCRSGFTSAQQAATFDGLSWISFTNLYYWGALWLLSGSATPETSQLANIAY